MPNAFELLTENSTAAEGSTAWQHINAQKSGGAGDVYIAEMVNIVDDDNLVNIEDDESLVFVEDSDTLLLADVSDEDLLLINDDSVKVLEL